MKQITLEEDLLITISAINMLKTLLCPWIIDISDKWVHPRNEHANDLFFIYLIDFLSEISITHKDLPNSLLCVCEHNILPINNSNLKNEIFTFNEWLNVIQIKPIYLAEINKNISLNISVKDMIYFTGNKNKHHPLRLQGVIKRLSEKNTDLTKQDILLSFDSFSEWITRTFLIDNFSIIVEFLVNIYNLLCSSLYPEFLKYYRKDEDIKYHYERPNYINTQQEFYWFYELMNLIRGHKPIEFKLDESFKKLLQEPIDNL